MRRRGLQLQLEQSLCLSLGTRGRGGGSCLELVRRLIYPPPLDFEAYHRTERIEKLALLWNDHDFRGFFEGDRTRINVDLAQFFNRNGPREDSESPRTANLSDSNRWRCSLASVTPALNRDPCTPTPRRPNQSGSKESPQRQSPSRRAGPRRYVRGKCISIISDSGINPTHRKRIDPRAEPLIQSKQRAPARASNYIDDRRDAAVVDGAFVNAKPPDSKAVAPLPPAATAAAARSIWYWRLPRQEPTALRQMAGR